MVSRFQMPYFIPMPILEKLSDALPVQDPVLIFALVMWAILLAPILSRKLRIPDLIGLILAGIVLGEHGLGILERDETMVMLGTVGLLYIMFLAGLEIDLDQFFKERRNSVVFGLLTFVAPMVLGTAMALVLLRFSWPASILLASMFASHTLVAYPIITRLGITRNRAVTAAIGGTIITDTLALLVLAVIAASVADGLTLGFWLSITVSLAVFTAVVLLGIPPLARYYFHKQRDQGFLDFVFVLAVGFLAAYLAYMAGVEAIIGAFFGGLALNRCIPKQSPLMHQVHFAGNALFVPFFLLSVGMLVDLRLVFSSPQVWLVGGSMVIGVIATKWLAARVAQRWLGFRREEGHVLFGLSVAQAAATLAAVFVGYRIGLFGDEVLNGAVFMILVSCILGPAMVDRFGRVVALQEELQPLKPDDTPLRILIPLANPDSAAALMDVALTIRRPQSREPVYPLTVADQTSEVERQVAASERMLGHAVFYASGAGVPVQPVTRVDTNVADGIRRAIAELRISAVVIGWTGQPSRRQKALGSVLDQLLDENRPSILVCRLLNPVNLTERVILLIPPLIERERGFAETIRTIKLMASRLGARLRVEMSEREMRRLTPHVNRIQPNLDIDYIPTTAEELLRGEVHGESPGREDLIILIRPREGRLSWTHAIAGLPLVLASRYPEANLILFHPSEREVQATVMEGPAGLLTPERTLIGLNASTFSDAIEQMVSPTLSAPSNIDEAKQALEQMARETPVEMAPGLVMAHAHVDFVARPLLFVATFRAPVPLPDTDESARIILLLLSPRGLPPEEHLRTLAFLAQMVRRSKSTDPLLAADTVEELHAALNTPSP